MKRKNQEKKKKGGRQDQSGGQKNRGKVDFINVDAALQPGLGEQPAEQV